MSAHNFDYKIFCRKVAEFVITFYRKFYNTFKANLFNIRNFTAADMLSQKHTKHRRADRIFL